MSISRSALALLVVSLLMTGAGPTRVAAAQAASPQAQPALQAQAATNLPAQPLKLIPMPREVSAGATQSLADGLQINCAAPCAPEDSFAIDDFKAYLAAQGVAVNTTSAVNVLVARYGSPLANSIYSVAASSQQAESQGGSATPAEMPGEMKPEGYAIIPDGKGLALTAASDAGIFYALQTVKQLVTGSGANAVLHTATIRDWPAMKYRGLDDDLSRGPVPTLDFQKKLIRTIADYKINLYSPYFEHTAAYAADPLLAPPGGSISAADTAALVAYARLYHVTVVPEQEAFGHLHNQLLWEHLQPLAETPHGAVLAPGQPGSLALIKQEFTELAAEYPGPFLHIGADETVDLGVGQTKPDVDARGLAPVYLDFMQQIATALQPLHRRLLFWGDIAQDSPDLLKALPQSFKDETIAVAWGYNPEPRGFARLLTPFINAGFETWVSPSVHNFRVVYPDYNLAFANIQQFTRDGQQLGLNRPVEHHLERRRRGTHQPGLVRRPLRRGGRVATGRIVHRAVPAELRAGLPRRRLGRAQPGAVGVDGRAQGFEGPGPGGRRHQRSLLARSLVEGWAEDRRRDAPLDARSAHPRRGRADADCAGPSGGRAEIITGKRQRRKPSIGDLRRHKVRRGNQQPARAGRR